MAVTQRLFRSVYQLDVHWTGMLRSSDLAADFRTQSYLHAHRRLFWPVDSCTGSALNFCSQLLFFCGFFVPSVLDDLLLFFYRPKPIQSPRNHVTGSSWTSLGHIFQEGVNSGTFIRFWYVLIYSALYTSLTLIGSAGIAELAVFHPVCSYSKSV
jgi:hypothetical protein